MSDERAPSADPLDDALRYVDEVAARAGGAEPSFSGPDPLSVPATIDGARHHIDEAYTFADAGTDLPADARMRQVKKAMLLAFRPLTSHQVPFNLEISVAVKDLATALEHLSRRVDGADRVVDTATARVHATLAAAELTLDDVEDTVTRLASVVESLVERTDRLEQQLATERGESRALRARQDIVLREARALVGGKGHKRHLATVAAELDDSAEVLSEDLAEAIRGTRDEVRAEVAPLVDTVEAIAPDGPVVDLGAGRGEWLEMLRERGIAASGVDASPRAAKAARRRGLDVRCADAVGHLADLEPASISLVSAFHLVERFTADTLVELFDRSLAALRPGGLLILSAANPTALDVGASEVWLDPAHRRPVHPQFLELTAVARGFAETEVRWLSPSDPAYVIDPRDLNGIEANRAELLADRLNRALAGPRAYAVLARAPGGTPPERSGKPR